MKFMLAFILASGVGIGVSTYLASRNIQQEILQ